MLNYLDCIECMLIAFYTNKKNVKSDHGKRKKIHGWSEYVKIMYVGGLILSAGTYFYGINLSLKFCKKYDTQKYFCLTKFNLLVGCLT